MAKTTNPRKGTQAKMNVWGMFRDLGVAAINKGQLPILFGFLLMIVIVLKMPPADVSNLATEILKAFHDYHILGWVLSLIMAILWFISSKGFRTGHKEEMSRVGKEKKELQEKLLGKKLPTSNHF